jgi:hypothetical protein
MTTSALIVVLYYGLVPLAASVVAYAVIRRTYTKRDRR